MAPDGALISFRFEHINARDTFVMCMMLFVQSLGGMPQDEGEDDEELGNLDSHPACFLPLPHTGTGDRGGRAGGGERRWGMEGGSWGLPRSTRRRRRTRARAADGSPRPPPKLFLVAAFTASFRQSDPDPGAWDPANPMSEEY